MPPASLPAMAVTIPGPKAAKAIRNLLRCLVAATSCEASSTTATAVADSADAGTAAGAAAATDADEDAPFSALPVETMLNAVALRTALAGSGLAPAFFAAALRLSAAI